MSCPQHAAASIVSACSKRPDGIGHLAQRGWRKLTDRDHGPVSRRTSDDADGAPLADALMAGYARDIEVELFNQEIWETPWSEVAARTAGAFDAAVVPHLAASVTA
ncbi:MAG: hypothetical protein NTW37_01020 [Proteobacteria bacterium]|nr:hypothetical protein [Pseudomonadota bacterium]